jgi:methylated-DNA-protein-cysteine methyltransferase related protein
MEMTHSIKDKHKDFFDNVFDVVRLIPSGRVTSYGAIARYLGSAKSSRMVGWAMNASHKDPGIPAHRVVNRLGLLTGKANFAHPNEMEEKLKQEHVVVIADQVINFNEIFWDPNEELNI